MYRNDPLSVLSGISPTTSSRLSKAKMKTIGDVIKTSNAPRYVSQYLWSSIKAKVFKYVDDERFIDEDAPPPTDHRQSPNPYQSLYGEGWEKEIESVSGMNAYIDVRCLIKHMYLHCKELHKDLPNPHVFHFWHDALAQMNNAATKQWMFDHGMLHHWILPEAGCNEGTRYSTHPPGNSPECMPLDCNLFKDWKDGIDRHVFLASHLSDSDPRKFSQTTPKRLSSAMIRVWQGIPSSERIVQDIKRVIYKNIPTIIEHKGIIVQGLGNRSGNRYVVAESASDNRGGRRIKGQAHVTNHWIHDDAKEAAVCIIDKALKVKVEQQQQQQSENIRTHVDREDMEEVVDVHVESEMNGIDVPHSLNFENEGVSDNMEYLSDLTAESFAGVEM